MFFMIGFGVFLLPVLFHLAIRLRLGIPMLYAVLALTVFHGWTQAHPVLADRIFFALIGLAALSWVVTAVRKIHDVIDEYLEGQAEAKLFACQVRQARAAGESMVSTKDLWY